jgi:glycosyltransferase involved in cell wall biosynthesis
MAEPRLSIVTCCKGRLQYLKQSLPTFVAQAESEVIVVDYDCPDKTGKWVATQFPGVHLVTVTEAPHFNLSHARNIGAAHARAPWLVFCDADDLLAPSFSSELLSMATPGTYQRTLRNTQWGLRKEFIPLACEAATFRAVGGYDDAIQGWGIEDLEFIDRLGVAGIREITGTATVARTLPQTKTESSRYYEHEIETSVVINHYYWKIKRRYFETTGQWFTDDQRHSTYGSVERAVVASLADPESEATYDVPVLAAPAPWSARLAASDVRKFHLKRSEKHKQWRPDMPKFSRDKGITD